MLPTPSTSVIVYCMSGNVQYSPSNRREGKEGSSRCGRIRRLFLSHYPVGLRSCMPHVVPFHFLFLLGPIPVQLYLHSFFSFFSLSFSLSYTNGFCLLIDMMNGLLLHCTCRSDPFLILGIWLWIHIVGEWECRRKMLGTGFGG